MNRGNKKLIAGAAVFGGAMVVGAACVLGAGLAKADFHQDVQFFELLDSHHIQVSDTGWAHDVCTALDTGFSPAQVTDAVEAKSPLDHDKALWFEVASMVVYCPWHQGQDYFAKQPGGPGPRHLVAPNEVAYVTKGGNHGHGK